MFEEGILKSKLNMSFEEIITGMAQIPKAVSQCWYLKLKPRGNSLGQSKEEGVITDNEHTRPTQGVLTLKRKSCFL